MRISDEEHDKNVRNLIGDLVKKFGNNSIISRKELLEFYDNAPETSSYPHYSYISNNPLYKHAWGKYKINDKVINRPVEKITVSDIVKNYTEDNVNMRIHPTFDELDSLDIFN